VYRICISKDTNEYRVQLGDVERQGMLRFSPRDGSVRASFQWLRFYPDDHSSVDTMRRTGLLNNELASMQAEFKKAFYQKGV
jgi:hypothetical protein